MAWYDNVDTRGYNNMLGTQAWPGYNPNLFQGMGVGRFDAGNLMRPDNLTQDLGAATYRAPPLQEEIINEDIHLDVGNNLPIVPNVPRPGENWPGFGIPRALAETAFRIKGGPYYSEKFPNRTFTEGDRTYNQRGLGGYFSPDEVFNMQQFGGVGEGDPRVDKFGKNIVSFADDYEEGLEDWVSKYGTMKYKTARMQQKQRDKIAMLQQIQNRDRQIAAANQAASNAFLASKGITHSGPGGGGGAFIDPGGRDRGGQGAFRENVAQMRGAGRSYTDARGNVGYSSGRKDGGRIGLRRGGDPTEWMTEEQETITPFDLQQEEGVPIGDMASDDNNTRILENLFEKYLDLGFSPAEAEKLAMEEFESMAQGPQEEIVEEGIASLV
jgi:hypothetical protein